MQAEIRIPGPDGWARGQVVIDGVPLRGVTGFKLTHEVDGYPPRLMVELMARELDVMAGDVELHVADGARETLIRFGWTPPADA